MKSASVVLLLLMVSVASGMDPPPILWERTYYQGEIAGFYHVAVTEDGGFALAGYKKEGFGIPSDTCLFRTDANGDLLWATGLGWDRQSAHWVEVLDDGGLVAVGAGKLLATSSYSLFLVRTDADGQILWVRNYDYPDATEDGYCVIPLPDSGFAVCSRRTIEGLGNQAWILRTDSEGDTLWTSEWGWTSTDWAMRVLYIDGGLSVLARGATESTAIGPHLLRYDMDGNLLWETPISELEGLAAQDMYLASDGGYVITTEGLSACVVHVDWDGNLIWQANLAGEGTSIAPTMDGGYIHAGYKEIIPDSPEPGIAFVTEGFDNEYYGLVFRYDQDGTMLWGDYVYNADCMYLYSICQLAQGGYIAAGNTTNGTGLLIRYAPETGIEEGTSPSSHLLLDAPVPNPSTGSFDISFQLPTAMAVDLAVYDLSGRRVITIVSKTIPAGSHEAVWDPGDAPSGGYLLVLRTEDETLTQACVLMR